MDKEKAELFALLFLCPFIRKEISVGFDRGLVRHFGHPVEQVGEIFEEVDAVQPAGTRQRIEDASALGAGMASEEQGVLAREGDVAVYPLNLIVVPGVIAGRWDGFDATPFIKEVTCRFMPTLISVK